MVTRFVIEFKRSATPSWDLVSIFLTLATRSSLSYSEFVSKSKKTKIYSAYLRCNSEST